ncbi:MAG: N-acetylmuramoyl-L-alanine amidase [Clostridia bacterium]|nr:N-acetylmuramoyl-L-alanine amidase [Clostridia bacterium]
MNIEKQKSSLFLYFFVAALLVLTAFLLRDIFHRFSKDTDASASVLDVRTVILDAGHGGFDGGAVSVTGTAEKVLNLDMTLTHTSLLRAQGYRVILTRDTDTELSHADGGSRKIQDLKGRLNVAETNRGVPFISLHMNKFPQSRYHGLQVYYSPNETSSLALAEDIRSSVKAGLQPANERAVKPATSAIYLLHKITSPAVLVECGFLSNEEEAKRLEDPEYRASLCLLIGVAYAKWEAAR